MIVVVHGYDGSGPGHWQRWLVEQLRARGASVAFPDLPAPLEPACAAWTEALVALVKALPPDEPVAFVAHSLGCWAVDHVLSALAATAPREAARVVAALLVAPVSPYSLFEPIQSFLPPPLDRGAWSPLAARSMIVASDNDDFASSEEAPEIAQRLGVPFHLLEGAGHINTAAGFGPWPFALAWTETLSERLGPKAHPA